MKNSFENLLKKYQKFIWMGTKSFYYVLHLEKIQKFFFPFVKENNFNSLIKMLLSYIWLCWTKIWDD